VWAARRRSRKGHHVGAREVELMSKGKNQRKETKKPKKDKKK
jgi:hypothetical protein